MASLCNLAGSPPPKPSWSLALAVFLIVAAHLAAGHSRTETRLAAGFNRRNRSLKGASPLWSAEVPSASQCLSACLRLGCQSLTYGNGRCDLFPTFLCHPEDRFHLSLEPASGVTYFDLNSKISEIRTLWTREACFRYGRCLEMCNQGVWSTTPKPVPGPSEEGTATTTETTTQAPSSAEGPDKVVAKANSTGNSPRVELAFGLMLIQEPRNFQDSLAFCKARNMSLAMPENRKEHEILVEAMKKRRISRMWIGVKKLTESGKDATYIDGRSVPDDLLLWGEGQPNNSRGKQICIEMIASLKYLWNDFDCLYKSAFVCR